MKKILILSICIILLIGLISSGNTDSGNLKLGKVNINYSGLKFQESNGNSEFYFNSQSSLTADYNGQKIIYSGLDGFTNKNGDQKPRLVFNENGRIIEAVFKTTKKGKYILGNEIIELEKDSLVYFKDGKAQIKIPGNEFKKPIPIDNKRGESDFIFFSEKGIKYGKYYIKGGLGYENGKYFIEQEELKIGDVIILNPEKVRTYIDFNGRVNGGYDGAYISMNPDKGVIVLGSNIDKKSPILMFEEYNNYGLNFDKVNDHFAIRAYGNKEGSYVSIKSRSKEGLVPEIEYLNEFAMNQDGRGVFYNSKTGNAYIRPNGLVINDDIIKNKIPQDSSSVAVFVRGYETKDGSITSAMKGGVIGVSNFNEIGFGKNARFVRAKSYKNIPRLYKGIFAQEIPNYDLTEKGFERLTGIQLVGYDASGKAYVSKPENIKYLFDLIASIPDEQMNAVKAIYMHYSSPWGYAYATSGSDWYGVGMSIHMTVGRGYMSSSTFRHEMAHIMDFYGGKNNNFNRMWYSSGIDRNVIVSWYARNRGERISEFTGNTAYASNAELKDILGNNWKNNKWYKAAFAVAWYNNIFTNKRIKEIFSGVGLRYDKEALYGYMRDIGISIS